MAPISELSHLTNPLITSTQLETSSSRVDGVPKDLEDSVRCQTAKLMQAAGILLRLPQDLIAQAVVVLYRFWCGSDGISMLEHDAKDVAAAALYLSAKPSGTPVSPRQVLVVFEYLDACGPNYSKASTNDVNSTTDWHFSEGKYEAMRNKLFNIESHILRVLGFQTHVALPYTLCINYLQTLDVFNLPGGSELAKRAFVHLNTALLSPQLLLLTHQPTAIATAAVYLAAREVDIKLPEANWWDVFDVDREELGFLVVAFRSLYGFVQEHSAGIRSIRLTVEGLRNEMKTLP